MCLDIENEYESIEEFYRILDKNSVKMSNLFGETTMNGGLHLYFRIPMDKKSKNQYKKVNKNVHFDLLFNGKQSSGLLAIITFDIIFSNLGRFVYDL